MLNPAEKEERNRTKQQNEIPGKTYPRYYRSSEGHEQICLENPVDQTYVRACWGSAHLDIAYYAGPLKKSNIQDIKNRFEPSTEEEFRHVFNRVITYFSDLKEVAPKVLLDPNKIQLEPKLKLTNG